MLFITTYLICKNHLYILFKKEAKFLRKINSGSTIVFKEVPAHICDNCGEEYIDDFITKELLKKAREIIKNGVEVDIRKYEIAA